MLEEVQPDDEQTISALLAEGAPTTSTTTSTTKPAVAPATVSVQVLNGVTFTKPLASDTAASLRSDGFALSGVANAPATVATTEIQYAPGHEAAAQTLQADVEGASQLVVDPSLSGDDVTLTLGSSFTSVHQAASSSNPGSTGISTPVATRTGTQVAVSPGDIYTNTQSEP